MARRQADAGPASQQPPPSSSGGAPPRDQQAQRQQQQQADDAAREAMRVKLHGIAAQLADSDRSRFKQQVFRPSHTMPTMTVEQQGEIERREAMEREAREKVGRHPRRRLAGPLEVAWPVLAAAWLTPPPPPHPARQGSPLAPPPLAAAAPSATTGQEARCRGRLLTTRARHCLQATQEREQRRRAGLTADERDDEDVFKVSTLHTAAWLAG
jgi:hypothetical protein